MLANIKIANTFGLKKTGKYKTERSTDVNYYILREKS